MRKLLLSFCLLFNGAICAQQATKPVQPTDLTNIPPSPEAANLGRYGSLPVGYYTGAVQLNIPLAEISDGPLQVPVSLSYNSTGNKVEDVASWVGLGWTLNAGGVITRAARGWADDAPSRGGYLSFLDLIQQHTWAELTDMNLPNSALNAYNLSRGCWDAEPDVFYFNFNGYTGQFAFDWNGQLVVHSDKNITVEPQYNPQRVITSWRVITEDGTVYTFASQEETTDRRPHPMTCRTGANTFISAWYLSSIADVNDEHRLTFAYDGYTISYGVRGSVAKYYGLGGTVMCPTGLTTQPGGTIDPFTYNSLRLRSITASHGQTQILFAAGNLRADTLGLTGPYNINLRSLARVRVLDAQGAEVKAQELTYDPAYSTGRLTLKSVQQTGRNGVRLPAYRLTYAGGLPDDVRSKSQDHWGFYNGAGNSILLPTYSMDFGGISTIIYPGGDRSVHPEYAQAGVLTKVRYPTGGYSEFTYESNDYSYVGGGFLGDRQEYSMQDIAEYVSAGPYSDPAVPYGTCAEHTQTFTIEPLPNTPANITRPVRVTWQGYNHGTVGNRRPYVAIRRADGTAVYSNGYIGAGNYMDQPAVENIVLPPGTYTLVAYACNPDLTYPNNPNGPYGPPYATIDVAFKNAIPNAIIQKKLTGGIRIKEIRDYAKLNDPNFTTRTFSYTWQGSNSVSSGAIYNEPNYEFHGYYMYVPDGFTNAARCDYMLHMARNAAALGTTQGSFVGYREVTVKTEGGAANGKTVYHYTSPYDAPYTSGTVDVPLTPDYSQSHMAGLLTEQLDYVSTATGYAPVKRLFNEYTNYSQDVPALMVLYPALNNAFYDAVANNYVPSQYAIGLGHTQLNHSQQTLYHAATGTAQTTDLYSDYNQPGTQLLTERQPLPLGRTQVTRHHYLNNYAFTSAAMADVLSRHAQPEVETVTSVETAGTAAVIKSAYRDWVFQNGKLRLRAARSLVTASPIAQSAYRFSATDATARPDDRLQETVVLDEYDAKGNVRQLHRPNGSSIVRLWGHGQSRLVAEVQNATLVQVAATSFEPGSTGGWQYDAAANVQAGGHTGDWSYYLDGSKEVTSSSGLPAGNYELTVWASVEPALFNGTSPMGFTKREVGPTDPRGLRLYHYWFPLATASSVRLTATTAAAVVDELRLYPAGAQVVTITYNAALEKTSQTDAANRTTRYEYDAFSRLQAVRDEQGRVLSEQQYHFARP